MRSQTRLAAAAATFLAVSVPLSACSGVGPADPYGENTTPAPAAVSPSGDTATSAGPTAAPSPAAENATGAAGAASGFGLSAVRTAALGWVVTDAKGWILYRFDKDRGRPAPASSCTGACATTWPPVIWSGRPELTGISPTIVGKTRRPDGSWQLTLHGWPVYRFAGDTRPGQWKGQGLGGTWHAILRNGGRNTAEPAAPSAATSTSGTQGTITDGYGNSSDY